jgi:hypothetical protein
LRGTSIGRIPGTKANHHGAPYALTEEFVTVYRLHPLLPDELELHSLADNTLIDTMAFGEIILLNAEKVLASGVRSADLFYSFGIQHPGAVSLHNYPRWMQDLTLPDGLRLDLGAVDIIRDRERGVPRYNEFRRQLHLTPAKTFADLTDNPVWANELEEMYGDVERVDLQIGMQAETPPRGFGFSDTAFRVFILMASRRIKSDRFLTDCFTDEYYTRSSPRPWTTSATPSRRGRRAWPPRALSPPTRASSPRHPRPATGRATSSNERHRCPPASPCLPADSDCRGSGRPSPSPAATTGSTRTTSTSTGPSSRPACSE